MSTVRIWIAGPRAWENPVPIDRVIDRLTGTYGIGRMLVITGGAIGVDLLTEKACNQRGIHVFRCAACWPVGRKAGPIRNEVIAKEFEPNVLIAFHYWKLEGTEHRGTRSAIAKAQKYDIPVKLIRVKPEVALPASADPKAPGHKGRARLAERAALTNKAKGKR